MADRSVVVIGGTAAIGRRIAQRFADRGREVVITGRDEARAQAVAEEVGGRTRGIALDLCEPDTIADRLAGVGEVQHVALVAIDRDENTAREYSIERGLRLVTLKLVGYTEVVHTLLPRMDGDSSILLFGGLARDRPYPGSTTVSTVNGGVTGMVNTFAVELAPIRVNAIHPGIVGDSPYWKDKPPSVLEAIRERTPLGRLVTMDEVADASVFLLENRGVNGISMAVDGGWLLK